MILLIPIWLPAAISAGGSILGGLLGSKGQSDANRTNREMAREQMAFQERMAHSAESFSERMASTSVQRSVADYKAAGLNPALAYERSSAAPTGVTAGGAMSRNENVMRDAPQLASNALATLTMKQQLAIGQAQEKLLAEQARNVLEDTHKKREESGLLDQTYRFNQINQPFETRLKQVTALMSALGITGAENDAELERKLQKLPGGSAKTLLQIIKTFIH